jgi:hypothetical protein
MYARRSSSTSRQFCGYRTRYGTLCLWTSHLKIFLHKRSRAYHCTCPFYPRGLDWDSGCLICDEDIAFVRTHLPPVEIIRIPETDHGILAHHMNMGLREVKRFSNIV